MSEYPVSIEDAIKVVDNSPAVTWTGKRGAKMRLLLALNGEPTPEQQDALEKGGLIRPDGSIPYAGPGSKYELDTDTLAKGRQQAERGEGKVQKRRSER